jgi:hypothetical protein
MADFADRQARLLEPLFWLVASASYIEIATPLYTDNLIAFFDGDQEIVDWLRARWLRDETRHGEMLKAYVLKHWPWFEWEDGHRYFLADYGALCTVDNLASSRTLEMVARCVVETGTASFYRMLSEAADDPELKSLASAISADEVRHYKHFYRYFRRYRAVEQPGRAAVLGTLWERLHDFRSEDTLCAVKAVHRACNAGSTLPDRDYATFADRTLFAFRRHFPCEMATRMYLKPLGLPPLISRATAGTIGGAVRLIAST